MDLSIVATVYNDAEIVPLLVQEIIKNIPADTSDYEIILVNDCSSDGSENAIAAECAKNPRVKGVSLRRNFGQQIAMSAGINYSKGSYVVIMDGDLQNPPDAIPLLVDKIRQGNYDLVYTVSRTRNNFWDGFTSALFWFVIIKLFDVEIIGNQLTMKIMTRDFAQKMAQYSEVNRTMEGITRDISSHHASIEIDNRKRLLGRSHYSFFMRLNLMIDMVISLSKAPLNFMIYLGFLIFVLTLAAIAYYLVQYIFFKVPAGYTSIILSIFFFGSLIVFLLGVIGRYLANIYSEVQRRPLYHVSKTYNIP